MVILSGLASAVITSLISFTEAVIGVLKVSDLPFQLVDAETLGYSSLKLDGGVLC